MKIYNIISTDEDCSYTIKTFTDVKLAEEYSKVYNSNYKVDRATIETVETSNTIGKYLKFSYNNQSWINKGNIRDLEYDLDELIDDIQNSYRSYMVYKDVVDEEVTADYSYEKGGTDGGYQAITYRSVAPTIEELIKVAKDFKKEIKAKYTK